MVLDMVLERQRQWWWIWFWRGKVSGGRYGFGEVKVVEVERVLE